MRIAILTSVFLPEYGVARVIAAQLPYLIEFGLEIDLYACEIDAKLLVPGICAVRVPTHLKGLRKALVLGKYDVVIAHTDPFFKFLAENDVGAVKLGYEHGYPPVEMCLPEERTRRLKEIGNRLGSIYPNLDSVVTISKYAVDYIQWPKATVIYNGADHYTEMQSKEQLAGKPLKILAVTRFRKEEWQYKGLENLCRLKRDLGKKIDVVLVGRGDEQSTAKLVDAGIQIVGVVSDKQEMGRLYESSDALISFSEWETFNLPLAEAGFSHKPALALNIGPHKEVTPFVFDCYEGIRDYLNLATRDSLRMDGEKMFRFVDARFRWKSNGEKLVDLLHRLCSKSKNEHPAFALKVYWAFWKVREYIRQNVYKRVKAFL